MSFSPVKTMKSAQVRRLIRISLTDPHIVAVSLLFSAVLFAANQQATLYDIQNPRWVLSMGLLILLSPIAHSFILIRVHALLNQGSVPVLKRGLAASAAFYPRLVAGEILVSLVTAAGMFLLLLPGIYIGLRLSFYKQEIVLAGKPLIAALRASMVRTRSWSTLGLIFLILAPIYGIEVLVGYIAGSVAAGIGGVIMAIFAAAIGFSLMNVFITAVYLESETQ